VAPSRSTTCCAAGCARHRAGTPNPPRGSSMRRPSRPLPGPRGRAGHRRPGHDSNKCAIVDHVEGGLSMTTDSRSSHSSTAADYVMRPSQAHPASSGGAHRLPTTPSTDPTTR
jgi:hypothetical protein